MRRHLESHELAFRILMGIYLVEFALIIVAACTFLPMRPWPDWAQGTVMAMLFGPLLVFVYTAPRRI